MQELALNDRVTITTQSGDIYQAIVLQVSQNDIFVKLAGFGELSLKWADISLIEKTIAAARRGMSYGPSYKAIVWQNNNPVAEAS